MNATLKITACSKIWEQHLNEEWAVEISLDKRYDYDVPVHSFDHNGEKYLFEIKETIIDEKILLTGWLVGDNKSGNIIFEIQ